MPRPNILFITTDQQRADSIGALDAPWMKTPHLDRLVQEGTAFSNCFVTSPVCVGSRASLFSGQYPHGMGVFKNFQPWEPTWVFASRAFWARASSFPLAHRVRSMKESPPISSPPAVGAEGLNLWILNG